MGRSFRDCPPAARPRATSIASMPPMAAPRMAAPTLPPPVTMEHSTRQAICGNGTNQRRVPRGRGGLAVRGATSTRVCAPTWTPTIRLTRAARRRTKASGWHSSHLRRRRRLKQGRRNWPSGGLAPRTSKSLGWEPASFKSQPSFPVAGQMFRAPARKRFRSPASLSSIACCNKKPTRYGQVEQRAADVSSAESSFFCRQDAASTLRGAERGTRPPSPTASQSSKNLAQSLSNEINDLEGRLDLQPKGRREINQTRARGGDKNRSKLRRQILVPEPFFPTSA